jgi:hypothetical protein
VYNETVCIKCELGKYAPNAQTDKCLDCEAGSFTSKKLGAEKCIACDAGTYSEGLTHNCTACPSGKFSSTRQSVCTDCFSGRHSGERAATCEYCPSNFDSYDGSSQCNLAADGYYLDPLDSFYSWPCPKNAECVGAYQAPIPNYNYWVDRRSYKYMISIHACVRSTCVFLNRDTSDTCWNVNVTSFTDMSSSECDSNTLICDVGSEGPLCGSCKQGYVYESISRRCKVCSTSSHITSQTWIGVSVVLALLTLVPIVYYSRAKEVFCYVDTGSLKVLWVTYQVCIYILVTLC